MAEERIVAASREVHTRLPRANATTSDRLAASIDRLAALAEAVD